MRYHCVQCDHEFELAAGEDKPRCPQCLRQHGLRPVERAPERRTGARGQLGGLVAACVIAVVGAGGYWLWSRSQPEAAGGAALDASAIQQATGLDAGDASELLHADDAIEQFAERATAGKTTDEAKAKAIADAISARAKKQAFVASPLHEPRETPAMTASQTWRAIAKDGSKAELYPLEVAALGVAALRAVGVPAQVFEVHGFGTERAPLDPSGRLGYYVFGLAADTEGGRPQLFDALVSRPANAPATSATALSDVQAAAGLLSLRGLALLVHGNDPGGALRHADAAVKLAPSSAVVRGVRAAVLLATGGKDEGARELEAAAQLRPGPAQQNNLAMYALATGDTDRAAKLVAQALSASPDYAAGHLTLASVHLARLERDLARAELSQVERLDPRLPALPLAWAELHAASGDLVQARLKAEEGVRLRPKSPETHLLLARVHRQAGNYDAMRREASVVLDLAPESQKDQIRQVLRAVLGPTALEEGPEELEAPAVPALAGDTPGEAAPGSLQLGGSEPKLRLGGDSELKLDLTH